MQYRGLVSNLFLSAILYAIPFIVSDHLWRLIFLFPVPLLYLVRDQNVSFVHGYVWGCAVFGLHLSGGIYLISRMAGDMWPVGLVMGIVMVLYQALVPAFLFFGVTQVVTLFSIQSSIVRLLLWSTALWLFIIWVDWYCLWIFGVQEGYPLMHPLLALAEQPQILYLLPVVGKFLLTVLFLLIPVSITVLLWYRRVYVLLFLCAIIILFLIWGPQIGALAKSGVKIKIKSLPCMVCSINDDPEVIVKIIGNHVKKIIMDCPKTEVIVMPESACNVSNFADISELLQLWNEKNIGKAVHIIFGASRYQGDDYYNTLYWVYDGVLQECHDKKHAMLLSERLSTWMNNNCLQSIYFNERQPIAVSCSKRTEFVLSQDDSFVPYICSELFFNELPDDEYKNEPIIVIVNDLLFVPYIQKLLVNIARFKAVQWQREIVYVSYTQSLFIGRCGEYEEMNGI